MESDGDTFLAALLALKTEVAALIEAGGGAQPKLAARIAQKLAIAEAAGKELGLRKDGPAGSVQAHPLAHRQFVIRNLTARPADGSQSAVFPTGSWPASALVVGMRLGVQFAAMTQDLYIRAMQHIAIDVLFPNTKGSLFGDGQTDASVPFGNLCSMYSQTLYPFIRTVSQNDEWGLRFTNGANGVANTVPTVSFDYLDLAQIGL